MIVNKPEKKREISRYEVLLIVMGIIFVAIIGKLLYLQVLRHKDYEDRANLTSTRFMSEKAPRGIIYDSEGNILASNKQIYTLTYTQTTEANKYFYETMDKVYKIIEENGEKINDDMLLKIDENGKPYFAYKMQSKDNREAEEIRFKRDRGLNEKIEKELYKGKTDFTEEERKAVNYKLLEMDAEQTFYDLVKMYGLINSIEKAPEKDSPNYKEEKKAYDERMKSYGEMTGEELTNVLLKQLSMEKIRGYMLIKDAIKMQSFSGERFVTIAYNISENTALTLYQKANDLPGINVQLDPVRDYPYGTLGSAVMGYVSPISSSVEKQYELRGYDASTDLIGIQGIESAFEEQLKGQKGGKSVKVNSKGKVTSELFSLETYPGNSVHLTIDKDIQYAAEKALEYEINNIRNNKVDGTTGERYLNATRGAAIAFDVNTGRILALASYPNFDPNIFAIPGQLTDEQVEQYFSPNLEVFGSELIKRMGLKVSLDELFPKDSNGFRTDPKDLYPKPFFNYATQGTLAPGSIFKPMTALIGLEEDVFSIGETVNDTGKFTAHPETFGGGFGPECWKRSGHGSVNVERALQVSCNYYFYETAYRLYKKNGSTTEALNSIAEYAWKFGLGTDPNKSGNKTTGIEIEEGWGEVYSFEKSRELIANLSRFDLARALESGNYNGAFFFIPFDYSTNEDDSQELSDAKKNLKKKVNDRLMTVGDANEGPGYEEFIKLILPDIKTIMDVSPKYKENVRAYEEKNGKQANLAEQAKTVANAISRFVVYDKAAEMKTPAQLVYASIGQGMNTFTPLQLASFISTLANGGTRYALHLVDKVTTPDGEVVQEFAPQILDQVNIKPENLAAIKRGMSAANEQDGGTAAAIFRNFPIPTAGKTGTADFSNDQRTWGRTPYATYVAFAPVDKPEIGVVSVIYDGGHGSWAAPVAKPIFEAYFKERLLEMDPNYAAKSPTFQEYVLNAPSNNKKAE
ncbi:MAG: penicillin-binding transpeptidase domain-containing protein [Clostridium sp.]